MSPYLFSRSLAIVIGINQYSKSIPPLQTAVNDAQALAQLLKTEHGYEVKLLIDQAATLKQLTCLIESELPAEVTEYDRVLFYFAGHGIAVDGDNGPAGYLALQDTDRSNRDSYLSMQVLHDGLSALTCRHLLMVLDCCFSGAFRWSSLRDIAIAPDIIYQERFDRFIRDPAWQVLTSAGYDQTALDTLVNDRGISTSGQHSPFSAALLAAISGEADIISRDNSSGDGVITATELYLYLRNHVEFAAQTASKRQTPGLWPLKKHDKGEYIFLVPGHVLNLPPAPDLKRENNPYRGLESFEEAQAPLFFGREELIEQLRNFLLAHPLSIVLGPSGSGKSSLVKAGLLPNLRSSLEQQWKILPVIRPGDNPISALARACLLLASTVSAENVTPGDISLEDTAESVQTGRGNLSSAQMRNALSQSSAQLAAVIGVWVRLHPNTNLLLVIDQFEELITACQDVQERQQFLRLLEIALINPPPQLKIVITLRSDFEPQLMSTALKLSWLDSRFIVPPMTQDDLRAVIERPAQSRVLYFEPSSLVDDLINEVVQMPGALPLLSFTLSELYIKYLERLGDTRSLTRSDYKALGGVIGSLTQRADREYEQLVQQNEGYSTTIRNIMLRMVTTSGGESARRRVSLSELDYPKAENEKAKKVIHQFVEARLLVIGQDAVGNAYVEPAHDALVRGWVRLQRWQSEHLESLTLQQLLTPVATAWTHQEGRKSGLLWHTNPRLNVLSALLSSSDSWLNKNETEFIRRSVRKKKVNGSIRVSFSFTLMLSLLFGSIISSEWVRVDRIQSNTRAAASLLNSNDSLSALYKSVKATQYLENVSQNLLGPVHSTIQSIIHPSIWASDQLETAVTLHQILTKIREKVSLEEHAGRINDVAFSPACQQAQGKEELLIASAGEDGIVKLRPRTGQMLPDLLHAAAVSSVDFGPDCQFLATASDAIVTIWATAGVAKAQWETEGSVSDVRISPDGETIATLSVNPENGKGQIQLWQLDGTLLNQSPAIMAHEFSRLDFSPDGATIAAGGEKTLYLWRFGATADNLTAVEAHEQSIKSVRFSPNEPLLATASEDGSIRFWNLNGGLLGEQQNAHNQLENDLGYSGTVNDLRFSPRDRTLLSVGQDQAAILWQLPDLSASTELISNEALSPDQCPNRALLEEPLPDEIPPGPLPPGFLTDATLPDELLFANPPSALPAQPQPTQSLFQLKKLEVLKGHEAGITSVSFNPNGKEIATVSQDAVLKIWDIAFEVKDAAVAIQPRLSEQAFLQTATQSVVLLGPDGSGKLWNLEDWNLEESNTQISNQHSQILDFLKADTDEFFADIALTSDKKILAVLRERCIQGTTSVELWDIERYRQIAILARTDSHAQPYITAMKFSPDGTRLAIATQDDQVQLWTLKGELLKSMRGHVQSKKTLSFSPDGKRLAFPTSSEQAESITLWSLGRSQVQQLEGHRGKITSIQFSPNSQRLASASEDQTVKIWNHRGTNIRTFSGHSNRVSDVAFYPGSQVLASFSNITNEQNNTKGEIKIWSIKGSDIATLSVTEKMGYRGMYFTEDGNSLISAHELYRGDVIDTRLIRWNLNRDQLLKLGCQWLDDRLINVSDFQENSEAICPALPSKQ
ncbi:MAG: caspase family protein [Cyanobacteria bacterium P01_D01_bin.1]